MKFKIVESLFGKYVTLDINKLQFDKTIPPRYKYKKNMWYVDGEYDGKLKVIPIASNEGEQYEVSKNYVKDFADDSSVLHKRLNEETLSGAGFPNSNQNVDKFPNGFVDKKKKKNKVFRKPINLKKYKKEV